MRKSKDAKLQLGEPWAGKLADFCAAHYGAPAKDVIRAALDAFIDTALEKEPEMKKRYEAARRQRLESKGSIVAIVKKEGD
jgi:aminoglycoside/choline kinase family phosphotransferase